MEKKNRARFSVYLKMEEAIAYLDDSENHLERGTSVMWEIGMSYWNWDPVCTRGEGFR